MPISNDDPLGDTVQLRRFIAPRYWTVWLLVAIMRLVHMLPLSTQFGIGRALGRIAYRLSRGRRAIAQRNIDLCFPQQTDSQRQLLTRRHFESLGVAVIEMSMSWWSRDERLRPLISYEGLEYLEQAKREGASFIILTAHFTTLEIGGRFLKLKLEQFDGVYRKHRSPFVNELQRRVRLRSGRRVIEKSDIRSMIRSLKNGIPVWYAPDQNYRRKYAELIDFFGVPAMTNTATDRLAALGNAGVLPFFCWRTDNDAYVVKFYPPLYPSKNGDDSALITRTFVGIMEDAIRRQPDQYLWVHRKFKGRPPSLPDVYAFTEHAA